MGTRVPPSGSSRAAVRRPMLGVGVQGLLVLCLGLSPLLPPSQGAMLIVPLFDRHEAAAFRVAAASDVRILSPGPLPGSYVVQGSRASLLPSALRHGMLLIDAAAAGCSPRKA